MMAEVPDFGEPWSVVAGDRHWADAFMTHTDRPAVAGYRGRCERAAACVNFLRGVPLPPEGSVPAPVVTIARGLLRDPEDSANIAAATDELLAMDAANKAGKEFVSREELIDALDDLLWRTAEVHDDPEARAEVIGLLARAGVEKPGAAKPEAKRFSCACHSPDRYDCTRSRHRHDMMSDGDEEPCDCDCHYAGDEREERWGLGDHDYDDEVP